MGKWRAAGWAAASVALAVLRGVHADVLDALRRDAAQRQVSWC